MCISTLTFNRLFYIFNYIRYSLILVCIGVQSFEDGFKHCLQIASAIGNTQLPFDISNIISSRIHFAENSELVTVLKPVVDSIARLEGRDSTLANVLGEFCKIRSRWSRLQLDSSAAAEFKNKAIQILGSRVKDYENDLYLVAFYLSPKYKKIAISRKMQYKDMKISLLNLLKIWRTPKLTVQKVL